MYGRGVNVTIRYCAGRKNRNADALSRAPLLPAPAIGLAEQELQVASITATLPNKGGSKSKHVAQTFPDLSESRRHTDCHLPTLPSKGTEQTGGPDTISNGRQSQLQEVPELHVKLGNWCLL